MNWREVVRGEISLARADGEGWTPYRRWLDDDERRYVSDAQRRLGPRPACSQFQCPKPAVAVSYRTIPGVKQRTMLCLQHWRVRRRQHG